MSGTETPAPLARLVIFPMLPGASASARKPATVSATKSRPPPTATPVGVFSVAPLSIGAFGALSVSSNWNGGTPSDTWTASL